MSKLHAPLSERSTKDDPILALAEYWISADCMHTLTHFLKDDWMVGKDEAVEVEFRTYLSYWLSALYVVVEGFNELS